MTSFQFSLIKLATPDGYICGKWWGPQNIRPILCLHGWLDNCGAYDKLIPLLPKNYSFLIFDLPGHGLSSRYAPGMGYNYYDQIILIERIRKAYGWDKVSLMGHSLGSMCCFYYSAVFPDKVDLFIALDNFTPRDTNSTIKMRLDMGRVLLEDDRVLSDDTEPPSYSYEQLLHKIVQGSTNSVDYESAKFLLTRSVKKSTKYPDKYYFNYDRRAKGLACPANNADDRREIIKYISCPVLFLIGRDSYMRKNPFAPSLEEIVETKKNFFYHFGPGNHHFLLTHPEDYADKIIEFLLTYRPVNAKL